MDETFINCQCYSSEHVIQFLTSRDDGEIYVSVFLRPWPWYQRVWLALRYVCKYRTPYGQFDCTIIDPRDFDKFANMIEVARGYAANKKLNQSRLSEILKSRVL